MAFESRNVRGSGRSNGAASAAAFEELEPRTLLSSGPGPLRLTVDFHTGVATITNTSSSPLTIDGYEIDSVGGHLNAATWYSIIDAATANPTPVVAALGSGATTFQEWGTAATALMEVSPTADVTFAPGASWTIGAPVNPDTASVADLTFQYSSVNVILGGVVTPTSAVTVTTVRTKDSTPALSGTVNNPAALVQVTVDGHDYNATNHGDGTWTLADNAITPALALGTYNVAVKALMGEQTVAQDSTTDELTVVGPWNVSIVKTKDASETLGTTTKKGLFSVTRSGGDISNPLTIAYSIDGASTATSGDDFAALAGSVTIPAGMTSATIDVLAIDDAVYDPAETVIVDLDSSLNFDPVAGKGTATVTITDNEPVVSIAKTKDAFETLGTTTKKGLFTVTRVGGNLAAPLEVHYSVNGASTATSGDDFTPLAGTVTIPAGKPSVTIDLLALDDTLAETTETVRLDLDAQPQYGIVPGKGTATASIFDNEPVVSIMRTKDAFETLGTTTKKGVFLVKRLGGDKTAPLVVHYSVNGASTATSGDDYTPLTGTVTIPAGKPSATIDVLALDDATAEPAETVTVDLDTQTYYAIAPGKASATVSIVDDEPRVMIVKTKDASETLGTTTKKGVFTVVRLGGNLAAPLEVHYSVNGASTATSGDDYTALTGTVTIPAGKPSATIDVLALSDALAEPTETVTVDLEAQPAYIPAAGKTSATVSILDNGPVVSIVRTKNGSESAGATTGKGVFTVTRAGGDLTQDLVVHYAIDPATTATAGSDYAALTGSVTIHAGQLSATIDVLVGDDILVEPTETVIVDLSADSFYHLAAGKTAATVQILDNEPHV